MRAVYWSYCACRREAAQIESERMHVYFMLWSLSLFAKKPVFPVLIPIRQRIALFFHALHDDIVRWTKPHCAPLLLGMIADLAKGKSELLVENALLRQQLIILRRQVKRPACKNSDRFLLLRAARGWFGPGSRHSSLCSLRPCFAGIVSPSACSPKHISKAHTRKPRLSPETISLIKEMAAKNQFWGAERIRGELLKLGIRRSQTDHPEVYAVGSRHFEPVDRTGKRSCAIMQRKCRGWGPVMRLQVPDLFFRPLRHLSSSSRSRGRRIHVNVIRSPTDLWVARTAAGGDSVWTNTHIPDLG